jgi:hypothetical protein
MQVVGESNFFLDASDFYIVVFGIVETIYTAECFLSIAYSATSDKPIGGLGEERPGYG